MSIAKKNARKESHPQNRMILSRNIQLPFDVPERPENANVLVVGGAGAGKLACYTDPNIMQANGSYVITDVEGIAYNRYGKFLEHMGYKVKCLDLLHMWNSGHYNPFCYIHCDKDIEDLAEVLISNTSPTGVCDNYSSFIKAEKTLLTALIAYLWYYTSENNQNFFGVMRLLRIATNGEEDSTSKSPLDMIFDEVAEYEPTAFAVQQYEMSKIKAESSWKSVVFSCLVRLQVFDLQEVAGLTNTDDLDLDSVGNEKTAIFVIIPSGDNTFNFLAAAMYAQLFRMVCDYCENSAEFSQLVMDGKGRLVRIYNAGNPEESKRMKEKANDFLEHARHGCVRKNELHDLYELVTDDGEVFGHRGSKEDAEAFLSAIGEGGYVVRHHKKSLPVRTRVMLDSFALTGNIIGLTKYISSMPRYGMSVSISVETLAQLKRVCKYEWPIITYNCGTVLYLGGGTDYASADWLSERMAGGVTDLSKKIPFLPAFCPARGAKLRKRGWGAMKLPHDECIVIRRGGPAYKDKKYRAAVLPNRSDVNAIRSAVKEQ